MSENLKLAKEALAKLTAEERYALGQFMAFDEPCDMHLQSAYECIDYADVHSFDGEPQTFELHMGMCLKPVMIQVNFQQGEGAEDWEFMNYDILKDENNDE